MLMYCHTVLLFLQPSAGHADGSAQLPGRPVQPGWRCSPVTAAAGERGPKTELHHTTDGSTIGCKLSKNLKVTARTLRYVLLLQGGDAGGDAAIFGNAATLATQQQQATALLVRAAQVRAAHSQTFLIILTLLFHRS
jgi:hypothetical protein